MSRREIREHLVKMLYCSDFHDEDFMKEQLEYYLENITITDDEKDYFSKRYFDIKNKINEIDDIISECSVGWKINRMSKIDLSILRLAVFEIKYDESIPDKVAVNEAIEIAKIYGGENSSGFINGILAKILE